MTITIPTTLNDITISDLVKWENSEKSDNNLIEIFCNVSDASIIPLSEHKEIIEMLTTVLDSTATFYQTFQYKGINFGFIPKLEAMTAGEFIDFEEYAKTPENWHKALSVIYRPLTKRTKNFYEKEGKEFYDIEPYLESHDFFVDAPCDIYLGAMVFFYNLGNDLTNAMLDYSQKVLKKQAQSNQTSIKSGVGLWLYERLQNLKKKTLPVF
jgi:hypothetical protein